jgi:PQQ-dependent dehydrogenase (methanol/ethanol family)
VEEGQFADQNIGKRLSRTAPRVRLKQAIVLLWLSVFASVSTYSWQSTIDCASVESNWPTYNRELSGIRFSGLAQIQSSNVAELVELCRVQIAETGSISAGPVVIDGIMYVTSDNLTAAISTTSCRLIWKVEYRPDEPEVLPNNRGVAFLAGHLFRGTGDGRLVSYDAITGQERWRVRIGDPGIGEFASAAPVTWNGLVYLGMSGGELGTRGRIMAFDADSGAPRWTFDLVPRSDQFGSNTWAGHSAEHGGGATWSSYTLDPNTGELFVSVDNPSPTFYGSVRAGDNLFTDSLVVLNAATGQRLWHYQLRKHDTFDYGASPPAVLLTIHGRQLIAQGSKDGYLYLIDRKSHRLAYKTPVTTVKEPATRRRSNESEICPGISGGFLYNSPNFDPSTSTLISGTTDWCSKITVDRDAPKYQVRHEYSGGQQEHLGPGSGWITSVDASTGSVAWRFHTDFPVFSAVTSTAGGVTFAGDHGGDFFALRTSDGAVLWKRQVQGSIAGGIITYKVLSKQYVALVAGNAALSPRVGSGPPSVFIYGLPN